jgi:hypothetical protein
VQNVFREVPFRRQKGRFLAEKLTEELHKVWITLVVDCGKMW